MAKGKSYTPYYDAEGNEYKIGSVFGGERKVYTTDGRLTKIDVNSLSKGPFKKPLKKTDVETATFSEALQTPDSLKTDAQKTFLGEYAPKLFPQYVTQDPVDPMKGMNEFQKAAYRNQQFKDDVTYKNTVQAYADSSTIYDKTKLPQFMLSREKSTKINKLNSEIEALQGEIDSYIITSKKKGTYVNPSKKKEHAKAVAQLKFKESELLKFKGLKSTDPLGLGL